MKVAAASTTIPVTNAAMQEYAKIFVENSGHCIPRAPSPICATRPLQDRGEKVKFFELVPLNACKKTAVYATSEAAMTAFAKGWAGVMIYRRPHH